jgi:hypothetical protein
MGLFLGGSLRWGGLPDGRLVPAPVEGHPGLLLADDPAGFVLPVIPAPGQGPDALVPEDLADDVEADAPGLAAHDAGLATRGRRDIDLGLGLAVGDEPVGARR